MAKQNTYTAHILEGLFLGLQDTFNALRHPIKNAVLPSCSLILDSSLMMIKHLVPRYSYVSRAAQADTRMKTRMASLAEFGSDFLNASGHKKATTLTRISVSLLFISSLATPLASSKMRNIYYFGSLNKPVQFKNLMNDETLTEPFFELLDKAQIRKRYSDSFIYVIVKDGKLNIADEYLSQAIIRNGQNWSILNHHDLAKYEPVYAAGHVMTKSGYIELITRESGHYQPHGDHLGPLIEHVFIRHGFTEARGKYNSFVWGEELKTERPYLSSYKQLTLKNKQQPKTTSESPRQDSALRSSTFSQGIM